MYICGISLYACVCVLNFKLYLCIVCVEECVCMCSGPSLVPNTHTRAHMHPIFLSTPLSDLAHECSLSCLIHSSPLGSNDVSSDALCKAGRIGEGIWELCLNLIVSMP